MAELEDRLRAELGDVLDRIRGADGAANRPALIERANDLAETLDRIRHGDGGI
jgi:hypothetical protein